MTTLWLMIAALVVPLLGSEVALAGRKLQSRLGRVLVVWLFGYTLPAAWILRYDEAAFVPSVVFWCGTFLLWFGARSHLESSILLRLVVLLRHRPMTDARLLEAYVSTESEAARLAELQRDGLIMQGEGGPQVTRKGRAILFLVSKLR